MLVTAWLSTATAAPLGADRRAPTRQPGSHGLESQAPESQSLRLHANLEYLTVAKGVREAVGITLSRDQYDAIVARKIPNATATWSTTATISLDSSPTRSSASACSADRFEAWHPEPLPAA